MRLIFVLFMVFTNALVALSGLIGARRVAEKVLICLFFGITAYLLAQYALVLL